MWNPSRLPNKRTVGKLLTWRCWPKTSEQQERPGHVVVSAFCDDVIMLAQSEEVLLQLWQKVLRFASTLGMEVSANKSLAFTNHAATHQRWLREGAVANLMVRSCFTYLGATLHLPGPASGHGGQPECADQVRCRDPSPTWPGSEHCPLSLEQKRSDCRIHSDECALAA